MTEPSPQYRPADATRLAESPMVGIAFMLMAVTVMFPTMNAAVKYLAAEGYPYGQIVWARYFGHLVFMVIAFMPMHGWALFRTERPGVQGIRSLLLFGCTALYFFAIQHIDLTVAASISFTSPILVTALSVPFLGEKVGVRRSIAVVIGFIGAMIIIRPGGTAFHWAMLLVVLNTVCYAFYQLLTRKIASADNPETTITMTAVVGAVISSFFLINGMEMPHSVLHWVMFVGLGALGGFGHYMVVKAFQYTEASVVAPFSYGQLVGATFFGYVMFGTFPDEWVWVGAAIVVASGVYIASREQKLRSG
ncbi:MAG: DMT family transporter [Minwuia sp.]|uniref:DMT family transporter n=1 Tax=Minwuia sp. TaxID=2493630 RepID=UPI003A8A106B